MTHLRQCRKFNDDVIFVTQHHEKVDKNFRRNATKWVMLRNLGRQPILAGVGFPGRFRWVWYENEPLKGEKAEGGGWFTLKKRPYGKLYKTTGGVGLKGMEGVTEDQARVGHWWRWVALGAVVLVAAYFVPRYMMKGSVAFATGSLKGVVPHVEKSVLPAKYTVVSTGRPGARSPAATAGEGVPGGKSAPPAVVTGDGEAVFWVGTGTAPGGVTFWFLSDGRVYRSDEVSPTVERGAYIKIGAEVFQWRSVPAKRRAEIWEGRNGPTW